MVAGGVPLVSIFFHIGPDPRSYHFTTKEPLYVNPASRSERQAAIQASAQAYANRLEDFVRQHPFDWFHFRSLFSDKGTRLTSCPQMDLSKFETMVMLDI